MSNVTPIKRTASPQAGSLPRKSRNEFLPRQLEELRELLNQTEPALEVAEDEKAIADAEVFHDRFGYNWKHHEDRAALFELKNRYSLNDRAIRMFLSTGNIKRTKMGMALAADPAYAFVMGAMSGVAGLFTVLFLILTGWSYYHGVMTSGIGLIYSLFLATLMCLGIRSSVIPGIFQHRVMKRASQDMLDE